MKIMLFDTALRKIFINSNLLIDLENKIYSKRKRRIRSATHGRQIYPAFALRCDSLHKTNVWEILSGGVITVYIASEILIIISKEAMKINAHIQIGI